LIARTSQPINSKDSKNEQKRDDVEPQYITFNNESW